MCNFKLSFIFLFIGQILFSQNYFYKTYTWEKQPALYKATDVEKKSPLVLVKDYTIIEAAYDKDGQAVIYETHHRKYHVNTQKGVEEVNKVYISTAQVNEEIDLKARCLTAENKLIPFNSDNVKRVDNIDNTGPYTIFTIDGVDIGSDVEYIYTNKRTFFSYALYRVNNVIPIAQYDFLLSSPKNLVFETKSYNGLTSFVKDTTDKTKNVLRLSASNIPVVEEEKYSSTTANKPVFSMQLAYNTDKSNSKFFTWETIAKGYYTTLFSTEKSEQKSIEKFLDKNKITKQSSQEDKIRLLESAIKLEYSVSEANASLPINKALEAKSLDEVAALKLYIYAFKYMQIPFELVITCDRMNKKFDGKYPSKSFLDDILFYFPEINMYTSPLEILSRVNFPKPTNTSGEGLFIKEIVMADIGMPSTKIKTIKPTDYSKSYHNISVKAKLNAETLNANLNFEQNLMGYSAYYVQPIYTFLNQEQKNDIDKSYYIIDKPETIKDFKTTNTDKESIFTKPLTITYTQELSDVMENAGDKFTFKVGELIGQQAELYQDGKRVSDGEIYFTHSFKREIEIEIPANYKAMNLDELKISKKCLIDNKEAAQFVSDYKIEGNKIIITVYEDYREINYPLSVFDSFKDVINAAADFNKKTIVFGKI